MQVDKIPMSLVIEFVESESEEVVARRRNSFVVVRVVVELGIDGSEDDLDGLEGCKVQKGCILHPDELELDKRGGDVEVKDKSGKSYERVKLDYDLRKKYGSKSLWKEFVRVDEKNGIVREEGGRRFDEKQKKLRRGVVVVVVERSCCKGSRSSGLS